MHKMPTSSEWQFQESNPSPCARTQFIMEQQDTTLTSLGYVVGTLRSQAMSVGTEVMDQVSYVGLWLEKHAKIGLRLRTTALSTACWVA